GSLEARDRLAVGVRVDRAQNAVTIDERLKGAAQGTDVDGGSNAPDPRHVVRGAVRIEPLQQPEGALAVREPALTRLGLFFQEPGEQAAFLVGRQARDVVRRLAHAIRLGECRGSGGWTTPLA